MTNTDDGRADFLRQRHDELLRLLRDPHATPAWHHAVGRILIDLVGAGTSADTTSRITALREYLRSQGDVRVPSSTSMVHMVEFYLRVPPEDLEQYEGLNWFTAHQLAMLPPSLRRRYLPMVREHRLSGRQLREALAADRRHRTLFELSSHFMTLFTSMLATVAEAKFKSLQFARCIDKLAPDRLSHHRSNLEALDELIESFEVELLDRATTVGSAVDRARQKLLELPPATVPDSAVASTVPPAKEGNDSGDGSIEHAAWI